MSNISKTSVLYYLFMTHLTTLAVARTRGAQIPGDYAFCTVGTNIFGAPVWNCLHVNRLAPRILRWLLHFLENLYTPGSDY